MGVAVEIGGIGLLDPFSVGIQHVRRPGDADPLDLPLGQVDELLIGLGPQLVPLVAEVFEAHPHGVFRVLHHIGGPVVEDLDPAQLHVLVLNVDPAVRDPVFHGPALGVVSDEQILHQKAHGDEVPIGQGVRGLLDRLGHLRAGKIVHELPHGHGGEHRVRGETTLLPRLFAAKGYDPAVTRLQGGDGAVHLDLPAQGLHLRRRQLPQLSGTQLGIEEPLDEGGLHLPSGAQEPAEDVLQDGADGEALHPLGAPVRGDLGGVTAPDLLRVALEKHGIQHSAEAVDVEVLQGGFGKLANAGEKVAEPRPERGDQAHVAQGGPL